MAAVLLAVVLDAVVKITPLLVDLQYQVKVTLAVIIVARGHHIIIVAVEAVLELLV